jgi:hypothetical protein
MELDSSVDILCFFKAFEGMQISLNTVKKIIYIFLRIFLKYKNLENTFKKI